MRKLSSFVLLLFASQCLTGCIGDFRYAGLTSLPRHAGLLPLAQTGDVQDFYCNTDGDCDAHLPGKGTWFCQGGHGESPTGGMCEPLSSRGSTSSSGDGSDDSSSSASTDNRPIDPVMGAIATVLVIGLALFLLNETMKQCHADRTC